MANKSGDYGIEFVNIELKFGIDLVAVEDEILSDGELMAWVCTMTRNMFKVGLGYNSKSQSFTASITDRGSVVGDAKPLCLTQHGKNHLQALQKIHFLVEVCGGGELSPERINYHLQGREDTLQEQIAKLLKR